LFKDLLYYYRAILPLYYYRGIIFLYYLYSDILTGLLALLTTIEFP
jgi:hypothetical protein